MLVLGSVTARRKTEKKIFSGTDLRGGVVARRPGQKLSWVGGPRGHAPLSLKVRVGKGKAAVIGDPTHTSPMAPAATLPPVANVTKLSAS